MNNEVDSSDDKSRFWEWQVNVPLLGIAIFLTVLGVKSLTLLPDAYYFGFSKIIGWHNTSDFLIHPPVVGDQEYGKILEKYGHRGWEGFVSEGTDGSPVELPEAEQERRINAINEEIERAGRHHFWTSLGLKMAPPFFVGLLMFVFLKERAITVAPLGAGTAAFMLAWPVIALWDNVVSLDWSHQRYMFFILYVAYVALYYHLGRLGCYAANFLLRTGVLKASKLEIDLGKIFSSLISTGITVVITWVVTTSIAQS